MDKVASIFNKIAPTLEGISSEFYAIVMGVALGWGAKIAKDKLSSRKGKKALQNGALSENTAIASYTDYLPTGLINPKTGNEFREQIVRNLERKIALNEIFDDPNIQKVMMDYFKKAQKLCTAEEPMLFQHLEKVVPAAEWPTIQTTLISKWKTMLGSLLTSTPAAMRQYISRDPREVVVEDEIIGALVHENKGGRAQYYILLLSEDDLVLPQKADVQFSTPDKMERMNTIIHIMNALNSDQYGWLKRMSAKIPTDEYRTIAEPALPEVK